MRIFLAVAPNEAYQKSLEKLIATLSSGAQPLCQSSQRATQLLESLRWQTQSQWHLTLAFLGQCDTKQLHAMQEEIAALTSTFSPLTLRAEKLTWFPSAQHAHVLALSFAHSQSLAQLQHTLASGLQHHSKQALRSRPFQAHITLARCTKPIHLNKTDPMPALSEELHGLNFSVDHVNLYSSITAPEGAQYKIEQHIALVKDS